MADKKETVVVPNDPSEEQISALRTAGLIPQDDSETPSGHPWVPIFVCTIAFAVLVFFMVSIYNKADFLELLREPEYARGLITSLVSVAAITLGFVIVMFAFFGSSDQFTEARFRRAREIFVAMMGVLGTIVGFYFGSTDSKKTPLKLSDIKVETIEDKKVATMFVAGGSPPYHYLMKAETDGITDQSGITTSNLLSIEIPSKAPTGLTIEITDSKGETAVQSFAGPTLDPQ